MSIFEFGTSISDIRKSVGTLSASTSSTSIYDDWVNEGVVCGTNQIAWLRKWGPQADGCFSCTLRPSGTSALHNSTLFAFLDDDDNEVLRLVRDTTDTVKLEAYVSGSWAQVGSTTWTRDADRHRHVFIWDLSSSGRIAWYIDATEVVDEEADYSSVPSISSALVSDWPSSTSQDTVLSEWIGMNEISLTTRYKQNVPTSDGANTDFTGSYTDIDEIGIDRNDAITSTVAGDISTFKAAARTFAVPNKVLALALPLYGRKSNSGPSKVIPTIRKGGVNYSAGDPVDLTFGNKGHAIVIPLDPATSADWSLSDANDADLEFGVESAT